MFAKPVNLILVYIITTINIVVMMVPMLAIIVPFVEFKSNIIIIDHNLYHKLVFAINFLLFLVSFLMLFYMFIDFLFAFSVRSVLKGCVPYSKIKEYDFLTNILNQTKDKFGERSLKLYIKKSPEVNAFAVGSLNRKVIVMTSGLIDRYVKSCSDPKEFLYSLRSVMGHEMSHLANKDFLPSFLIIINQKATNFISKILHKFFVIFTKIIRLIPYVGSHSKYTVERVYIVLNLVLTFFNRTIVFNIYKFLRNFISRSVEYRCDMESAKAFGGINMARALSMLGERGYFTLFSTHPGTKNRIKKVQNVKISDKIIRPSFINFLSNYFAIMFLIIICLYFAKQAHIDLMVRNYIIHHENLYRKVSTLVKLFSKIF